MLSALFFGFFSPIASAQFPQEPNQTEKDIFSTTLDRLNESINKGGLVPHSVNDTIGTFSTPFTAQINCSDVEDKEVDKVLINITTELVKWNATEAAKIGDGLAGAYFWNPGEPVMEENVKKINFTNYIMFDSDYLSGNNDTTFGQILNDRLLYHELLHGQLLIDAIKTDANWKEYICKCKFNNSLADVGHKIIPDLESKLRKNLASDRGFEIIDVKKITVANETGHFEVEIINISKLRKEFYQHGSYVPPGGNVDQNSVEFVYPLDKDGFIKEEGPIKVKGELIDENKEGKVEVFIDPDNIGVFAEIIIEPVEIIIESVPTANPLLTSGILGIALVLFLRRKQD